MKTRLTKWILCDDWFLHFEFFRFAFLVNSLYTELVGFAFLQASYISFRICGLGTWDPLPCEGIQFLDLIVLDRNSTIIFWFLPLELAAVLGDVSCFQGAFWFAWPSCKYNSNIYNSGFVLTSIATN
jgi:hypothetical protein